MFVLFRSKFSPKTDAAYENLRRILPELVALKPDYMTVTYGAFGSTQGRTLEIAAEIQKQFNLPTATHLTCVGSSRTDLDGILQQIEASGLRNIVALRGDPPQGQRILSHPQTALRMPMILWRIFEPAKPVSKHLAAESLSPVIQRNISRQRVLILTSRI